MEIKEGVYTLANINRLNFLKRNNHFLYCPFQSILGKCGEDCPAFEIKSNHVKLNCFPQPVVYEIKEAPNE